MIPYNRILLRAFFFVVFLSFYTTILVLEAVCPTCAPSAQHKQLMDYSQSPFSREGCSLNKLVWQ